MSELKRTQLYSTHVEEGGSMVDFGGWEMPVQYPSGIIAEHLYTRHVCSLFDVSHMGRLLIEGPERTAFLQHVLTSNVQALEKGLAQYTIIPNKNGGAWDDAYVYMFREDNYLLVVNAANKDKDLKHLLEEVEKYDCTITDITSYYASIAVQGPKSKEFLMILSGGVLPTEPLKNSLNILSLEGHEAYVAMTGYTGEPLGYEVYIKSENAVWLWKRLIECGARPAGLGARDTLRLEACLPLYGHEMGIDPSGREIPIFSVPLSRFAVSLSPQKGDFIGRQALEKQHEAFKKIMNRDYSGTEILPKRIMPIALLGRGIMREGMPVCKNDKQIGWVTSGTMVPYYKSEGEGLQTEITDEIGKRPIGLCYVDNDTLTDDLVTVDIRGRHISAAIAPWHMRSAAPPYARPILYTAPEQEPIPVKEDLPKKAVDLLKKAEDNHEWRQRRCINLIPSENSASRAVQLLLSSDPSFRYAEHKKIKAFYDSDIFYYQGTKFIDEVEQLLVEQMRLYLNCTEVETRVISGQMSNMTVFSALMDWKNRLDRKRTPKRLGYILNNHIIKGGHLSAQPMGALHDYVAVDPVTEKNAVVNFPVCYDNPFRIDVEETKKVIEKYRPELIIFGKSMVLEKEPVEQIHAFLKDQKIPATIMYDCAHVMGILGDHFQNPFKEGADIVTGSTHKTFFGPQRGIIGVNYRKDDLEYGLWETIERRAFPGSVSNHHLGTQVGLLMASYEMNHFKDEYQKAVIINAKSFAKSLKDHGLDVLGDPSIGYTQTHQVLVNVGYGTGPDVAERLEENGVIVNFQATPDEEGFTASGALRMGVSEMTRFGFGKEEFDLLAEMMADCILRGKDISGDVEKLRADHTEMKYCFSGNEFESSIEKLSKTIGY